MNLQGNTFFFPWEVSLMEWLQANLGESFLKVISYLSLFGEEIVLILLLGFLYWSYNKHLGKTVGIGALFACACCCMAKNIALRRRPYFDHENVKILRVPDPEADVYDIAAQGYSFPSIHSSNAASMYGAMAVNGKKKWLTALAFVIPLLVGFSRVAVGAHYPTDVLAGWAFGAAAALLIPFLQKKIRSTAVFYGILLAASLPGVFFCKSTDYFSTLGLMIGFMGGTLLDEKYVRFENTDKPLWMILRAVGGLAVYLVLNTLLKLPFSKEFLASGASASLFVRCARYAILSFVGFGVYPMIFKPVEKRFSKA